MSGYRPRRTHGRRHRRHHGHRSRTGHALGRLAVALLRALARGIR